MFEHWLLTFGIVVVLAVWAVVFVVPSNRIRLGAWMIATGIAQHERRVAALGINAEAEMFQRKLEQQHLRGIVKLPEPASADAPLPERRF